MNYQSMSEISNKSFLVSHWRVLVNVAVVVALAGLAFAVRKDLVATVTNLQHVNTYYLLLLVPVEFLNYDAQARLYRSMYGVLNEKLRYWFSFKLALELNFINQVFPSGGVSGIAYFSAKMRGHGKSGSRAFLLQIMKLMLTFLSFELVLAVGLVILAGAGHASQLVILFAGMLTTAILAGSFGFIYLITGKSRIRAFSRFSVAALNWLANISRIPALKKLNIDKLHGALDDLHENYKQLERSWRRLGPAFWHAFLMNVWEVLAVYFVFAAFGHFVNIGAIILAYAVANLAGLISVLPAGAGVYEALMTAVLVIAGVPAGVSIPAVIMYRIINTLIQLPPGYYLYQRSAIGKSS